MRTIRIVVGAILLLAAVAGVLLLSGVYDIGADAPHWTWVEQLAAAVRNASIAARDKDLQAPDLSRPEVIADGARHYAQMCSECHTAPGHEQSEIREGLYPRPPDLRKASPIDVSRAFWVIKHGIKMSAMPAWGKTHDDDSIWAIVAFLRKLPGLSAEEYQALTEGSAGSGHSHHHPEHGGKHSDDTEETHAGSPRR